MLLLSSDVPCAPPLAASGRHYTGPSQMSQRAGRNARNSFFRAVFWFVLVYFFDRVVALFLLSSDVPCTPPPAASGRPYSGPSQMSQRAGMNARNFFSGPFPGLHLYIFLNAILESKLNC